MAKKKANLKTTQMTLDGLIETGYSMMEELRNELQDWYDNLPDNFQSGGKGDELQSAIDAMQECDSPPDVPALPSSYAEMLVEVTVSGKRRQSRGERRDEACEYLRQATETISNWVSEYDLTLEDHEDDAENPADDVFPKDDLEALANDIENAIGEFENAEFPRMFG